MCEANENNEKRTEVLKKTIDPDSSVLNDKPCLEIGTVVLGSLDVVVKTDGFFSHHGNLHMKNQILECKNDFSTLPHRRAEWIGDFISGLKNGGSRFVVRDREASFRLATLDETTKTV